MKRAWTIISILAMANLLAMAGFAGWLGASGRLSKERMEAIRRTLSVPVAVERAEAEKAARLAAREASKAGEGETIIASDESSGLPIPASVLMSLKIEHGEVDRQRVELLRQQVEQLRLTLAREREELDRQTQALQAEREAFEAARRTIAETEGSEQFRKTVEALSSMSPKAAKGTLAAMLTDAEGKVNEEGAALVTAYLNAMDAMTRTAVLEAFQKDQPELAAQLLNRLRTYGQFAQAEDPDG